MRVPDELRQVDPPRALNAWEHYAISMILGGGDVGADAARVQLANAAVRFECGHCPTVDFELAEAASPIVDSYGMPVSGAFAPLQGTDERGVPIEIVLVVTDGFVAALEVWRGDGQEPFSPPPLHGFKPSGFASWEDVDQGDRFVTGGWAHRVEGGLDGDGWTVAVDGDPHRIDIEEPSPLGNSPRITVDGDRLKPKLRLAYNTTSAAPFRVGAADAQLRLHIWAPTLLERFRRTFLGGLRRLPIFFWMPHLAVSQADAGVEWRYTLSVDGTEMGTMIWFPGKGFDYAPLGSGD